MSKISLDEIIALKRALARISPEHRDILKARLEGWTLEEIGIVNGRSREWARQLEARAESALKRAINQDELDEDEAPVFAPVVVLCSDNRFRRFKPGGSLWFSKQTPETIAAYHLHQAHSTRKGS